MKKLVRTIAVSISMLASGVVLADAPAHLNTSGGDEMWIYHAVGGNWGGRLGKSQVEHGTLQMGDISPDGLSEYVRGEEETWRWRPHRYDLRGGRLVHVDNLPHDVPAANANLRREDYISPSDGGD